jgi:hypothetical protein
VKDILSSDFVAPSIQLLARESQRDRRVGTFNPRIIRLCASILIAPPVQRSAVVSNPAGPFHNGRLSHLDH